MYLLSSVEDVMYNPIVMDILMWLMGAALIIVPIMWIIGGIGLYHIASNGEHSKIAWMAFVPGLQFTLLTVMASRITWMYRSDVFLEEMRTDRMTYDEDYTAKPYKGLFPIHPAIFYKIFPYVILLEYPMFLVRCFFFFKRYTPEKKVKYTLLSAIGLFPIIVYKNRDAESVRIEWLEEHRQEEANKKAEMERLSAEYKEEKARKKLAKKAAKQAKKNGQQYTVNPSQQVRVNQPIEGNNDNTRFNL